MKDRWLRVRIDKIRRTSGVESLRERGYKNERSVSASRRIRGLPEKGRDAIEFTTTVYAIIEEGDYEGDWDKRGSPEERIKGRGRTRNTKTGEGSEQR